MKEPNSAASLMRHNIEAHDIVAELYDAKHGEIYNSVENARLERTVYDLLGLLGVPAPAVLDFGAGTGNLSMKFLAKGCRVTALDVSARSLEVLARKAGGIGEVSLKLLENERIPFPDATFNIAACYSVLHHVPDYLFAVKEMVRVLRPGGILYIDHEANEMAWSQDPALAAYRHGTRLTRKEHLRQLFHSRELFSFAFAKTVFMKIFVNPRYEREGDVHVWPDDHIEWDKIAKVLEADSTKIIRSQDYLLYQPRGGAELFERYRDACSDTRYIFAQKRAGLS